ncbi:hypothetical protein CEXT_107171 [Caerostris extrusa]|uniref:Uncharacterized protein n=1 Tax=Caerostris extrusa TaxID=172846 RepID=A0AAV4MZD1_CAEEX|nr:hypothetical protein CEXT_107171 [Caerostris extrusa]
MEHLTPYRMIKGGDVVGWAGLLRSIIPPFARKILEWENLVPFREAKTRAILDRRAHTQLASSETLRKMTFSKMASQVLAPQFCSCKKTS